MFRKIQLPYILSLLLLILIVTACTGTPEPTSSPTIEPTERPETVQTIILPSEVVVDKILVGEVNPDTGEIEVVVQGTASNTCTAVDAVTLSRDGEVFSLNIETTVNANEDCKDDTVPFEETLSVSTAELSPGNYLISSGVLASFVMEEPPELVGEEEGAAPADETPTDEESSPEPTSESEEQPSAQEPRDCEDLAAFVSDVTYPDNTNVQPGEAITKTWEIRNQGTCSWGPGYELKFTSGSFSDVASLSDPFPEAASSETIQVSVVLTTPQSAGTQSGVWVLQRPEGDNVEVQAGKAFDLWAIVRVTTTGVTGTTGDGRTRQDGVVCAQGNSVYEGQLLQLINNARTNNGLPVYEVQEQLTKAARVLSEDMACNDFVDHTDSDGLDWFDRITAQGYNYRDAAENIKFGYGTVPSLAFNWWMDSSLHRGNILHANLTQIGIAYALNPQTGGSYYTLVFADPEE